jgi:hypothetical protein
MPDDVAVDEDFEPALSDALLKLRAFPPLPLPVGAPTNMPVPENVRGNEIVILVVLLLAPCLKPPIQ